MLVTITLAIGELCRDLAWNLQVPSTPAYLNKIRRMWTKNTSHAITNEFCRKCESSPESLICSYITKACIQHGECSPIHILPGKGIPEINYTVSGGMLNPSHPPPIRSWLYLILENAHNVITGSSCEPVNKFSPKFRNFSRLLQRWWLPHLSYTLAHKH